MAHNKSAVKRIRQSHKANIRNRHYRTLMRTSLRRVREVTDAEAQESNLRRACAVLDRLVSKGIIHRNTAARRKSRLHKMVARRVGAAE